MKSVLRPPLAVCLTASALLATACVARLPRGEVPGEPSTAPAVVELHDTPFFPQEAYQCGPAALATVLTRSGVQVRPGALTPRVYIPAKRGSLQIELAAAARRYGRIPYEIRHNFSGLLAELKAGRPVLVLQNLGLGGFPVWHYAVVVGYDAENDLVILRSGKTERRLTPLSTFINTWSRAGFWGLVVLTPGELPVLPDQSAYLKAVSRLEAAGHPEAAASAYAAAIARWPESFVAKLGLGNANYSSRNLRQAEAAYREALALAPEHPAALNNLAQVLADQGCYLAALESIDRALSAQFEDELEPVLIETRRGILAGGSDARRDGAGCTREPGL